MKDTITITWNIKDVKDVRPDLSDDQCKLVLHWAKENHDANIGINWDVLKIWAKELYPE